MPASAPTEQESLASGGTPAVRPNFLRWIEAVAVGLATAAFVVIMFVLAFFFSIGLLLGLYQHVRRGDPAWKTDLVLVAGFVGSATGGVVGGLGGAARAVG